MTKARIDFEDLTRSEKVREFFTTFQALTGISLALTDPSSKRRFLPAGRVENAICGFIRRDPACDAACRQTDYVNCAAAAGNEQGRDYLCHAGLVDMTVPIFIAGRHVATIIGGQVLPEPPTPERFAAFAAGMARYRFDIDALREAYFRNPHMPPEKTRGALRVVCLFAEYVFELGERVREENDDNSASPIEKVKRYIRSQGRSGPIRLAEAAALAGWTEAYLSARFKSETGQTFTRFAMEARVEEAKKRLTTTRHPIAAIAFDVGFGSLTHFNRVFRRVTGQSPSAYRKTIKK